MSADADIEHVCSLVDSFSEEMPAERFAAWFDPDDVEIVPLRADLEGVVYRGPDAPAQFLEAALESWQRLRFVANEVRRVGELVLVRARLVARSRDAHLDIEREMGMVARLRGGLITYLHTYGDPADAIAAAEANLREETG